MTRGYKHSEWRHEHTLFSRWSATLQISDMFIVNAGNTNVEISQGTVQCLPPWKAELLYKEFHDLFRNDQFWKEDTLSIAMWMTRVMAADAHTCGPEELLTWGYNLLTAASLRLMTSWEKGCEIQSLKQTLCFSMTWVWWNEYSERLCGASRWLQKDNYCTLLVSLTLVNLNFVQIVSRTTHKIIHTHSLYAYTTVIIFVRRTSHIHPY
jgi:hypothetical protein